MVPQHRSPTQPNVADEVVSNRMVRATTNVSGIEAGQASGNVDKTQPMATYNESSSHEIYSGDLNPSQHDTMRDMPHDSPLPRVNTLGSDAGSLKYKHLVDICTKLLYRVTGLEADLKQTKKHYGAA